MAKKITKPKGQMLQITISEDDWLLMVRALESAQQRALAIQIEDSIIELETKIALCNHVTYKVKKL
jgi:hypothetical protein